MSFELSIVILTCDSVGIVERLVDALLAQQDAPRYEVLFMDNASVDGTVEYLESVPIADKRIVNVPKGEFSHSGTRMRATEMARGRVMVFFVDDIVPIGPRFLHDLTQPVLSGGVPAAYGVFQIHPQEHDPIDAHLHNLWFENLETPVGPVSEFAWRWLPGAARRQICNFDNCSSAIERQLLLEVRFPEVNYGEDMTLAKRLLWRGERILMVKTARFYHWHRSSFSYVLERMCIDADLTRREFGHVVVKRKLGVVRAIAIRVIHRAWVGLAKLRLPLRKRLYWIGYNAKVLTADFCGKYIGNLRQEEIGRFSLIDRRLLRVKQRILGEVEAKSVKRY
jgi:rhamnosyltransferase